MYTDTLFLNRFSATTFLLFPLGNDMLFAKDVPMIPIKHMKIYFLKLVSAIFYQFLFLHQMIALWKLWKMLFISSFRSWDIQVFLFPSSPIFLPVGHWFGRWSKINLKVYDVIKCLNKNLRDFVWYHQKEKNYDIETLSIDRVLNKEHFSWKIMQKICTKS